MRKYSPTTWYCETLSPRFVENLRREALGKNPASGQRGFCFLFFHSLFKEQGYQCLRIALIMEQGK